MQLRNVVLSCLAAAGLMAAADAGYFGEWKLDSARSDFGDTSFTISQTPSGGMQFSADGQSYTFKTDGKEYPAMFGGVAAWKSIDASTWEVTNKLNGTLLGTDTYRLSADGKSLTVNSKGPKPSGGTFDDTTTFQRVSGTSGIAGKWKTKNYKSSAPDVMQLAAAGADGMTFTIIDQKAVCNLKFDGKDYPSTGDPNSDARSYTKVNAHTLKFKLKSGDKVTLSGTIVTATDGKSRTVTASGTSADGKKVSYTAMYAKQ